MRCTHRVQMKASGQSCASPRFVSAAIDIALVSCPPPGRTLRQEMQALLPATLCGSLFGPGFTLPCAVPSLFQCRLGFSRLW